MFLSATALVGSLIPVLRVCLTGNDQELSETGSFTAQQQYNRPDSLSAEYTDSLAFRVAEDSLRILQWRMKSDSIKNRLSGLTGETELDSLLSQTGDEPLHSVSINMADALGFASLPGIGPKLAERIVDYRNQHGSFRKVEDIKKVKGIGNKLFSKIKPYITL